VRLCIFDVGGVMVDGFDVAPDIAARLGLTVSELRPLLRASSYELLHTGRISSPEFWDRFRATTGLTVDDEYWGAFFRPQRRPRPAPAGEQRAGGGRNEHPRRPLPHPRRTR
jgi:hypothetical protein